MTPAKIDLKTVAIASMAILAWLFCAFSTANIARANGQNYNLWLLVGLLTGPLGLMFAYLFFRLTGERTRRTRYGADHRYDVPDMISCPNCGQSVPRSYDSCQFCRFPLHGRR